MKIVSGRIAVTTIARSVRVPGVSRPSPNAVLDTQLRREPQMHLDVRLGVLFDERADPARLRSRQKLTHHLPTFAGRAEQLCRHRRRCYAKKLAPLGTKSRLWYRAGRLSPIL
jgi:hypothetical protein